MTNTCTACPTTLDRNNLTTTETPDRGDGGMIRHESYDGEPHIVMPSVLVRAQVLGQEEYLPFEEIQESVEDWRGVPVVVHHPEKNGKFVSARKIDVREQEQIGFVANPRAVEEQGGGKLVAELWLSEEKVRQDELIYQAIEQAKESNRKIEVSTGYRCEVKRGMGMDGSTKYYKKQVNLRPDHLALLPDGIGNCSVEDGCGAPRLNQRSNPREPEYSGKETIDEQSWGEVNKDLSNYVDGYFSNTDAERPDEEITQVEDLSQEAKNWIASKTMLGVSNADSVDELIYFPVVNPSTDNLSEGALRAVIGGRGEQADIESKTLTQTQAIARRLLEEEFDMAEENVENEIDDLTVLQKFAQALNSLVGQEETEDNEQDEPTEQTEHENNVDEGGEEVVENESEQDERLAVLNEAGIEDADELADVINAGLDVVNERQERKNELVEELCESEEVEVACEELENLCVNSLESIKKAVAEKQEPKTNHELQGGPRNNGGQVNNDEDAPVLGRPSIDEE